MDGHMELGQVFVQTTENRGYTPEEIAERATTRILRIQTKEELNRVLVKYLQEAYTVTNEVSSSGTNYTAVGLTLTITQVPTFTSTTAWLDFDDVTFSSATITSNGALIYNVTQSNKAVAVLAFGGDKTSTAGNFTIQFPAATSTTAILRIA